MGKTLPVTGETGTVTGGTFNTVFHSKNIPAENKMINTDCHLMKN